MSKSFIVNLGKGFEEMNRDSEPAEYLPFNTDSDLIVKGYMSVESMAGLTSSQLIIDSEYIKRYLYDVLKEMEQDKGQPIDQWKIKVVAEAQYISIRLELGGVS